MNPAQIAGTLARANLRGDHGGRGASLMPLLATVAFTVMSWLAATIAGGAWMFYERAHGGAELAPEFAQLPQVQVILNFYLVLTSLACVFLVPAMFSLTQRAAVLGASGRERRLAVLRLLGLSARKVTAVALVETLTQAAVGVLLGTLLSLLTAPLWQAFTFQFTPLRTAEMILPWWGYASLCLLMLGLAAAGVAAGLRRVSVTPLGVARRAPAARMGKWRLWAVVGVVVVVVVVVGVVDPETVGRILPVLLLAVIAAFHLAMTWVLKVLAAVASRLPGVAHHTACRRIVAEPARTWNGVAVLAYLFALLGAIAVQPVEILAQGDEAELKLIADVVTGGYLTVGFAFVIAAVTTLLERSAAVYREQRLDHSLHLLGAPGSFLRRVAFLQVFEPLVVAVVAGLALGASGLGPAISWSVDVDPELKNLLFTSLGAVAGFAVVALAQAGSEALRTRVRAAGNFRRRE